MDSKNATVDGNFTEGYAMEVIFSQHCSALFVVILGSLILGVPLAWNILWHLKESVCIRYFIFLWISNFPNDLASVEISNW